MKKNYLLFLIISVITFPSMAQVTDANVEKKMRSASKDSVEGWKKGGLAAVSLSQTSLNNWAAGGRNSLAFSGLLSLYANHKKGGRVS